jgi:SAM-dependent methyltransferase
MDALTETFLTEAFGGGLVSAMLTDTRPRREDGLRRVTIRPVLLRGKSMFQFEYQFAQKVQHRNLEASEAEATAQTLLTETFRQGRFHTAAGEFSAAIRAGKLTVKAEKTKAEKTAVQAAPAAVPLAHNRPKNYLLPEDVPVDFLVRLGVMTAAGRVVAAKRDKFKQINRFLEMVGDVAGSLPQSGPLRILDFGCGKAYLTFALYHYLAVIQQREVEMIGLDLKEDVVAFCAQTASELGCTGLSFAVGDIAGYQIDGNLDMVVTLHACDTATDDALAKAVGWGASVILSVPCCQHELFGQLHSDIMRPLLKHGILKERLTALVTDAVRASLLESAGYTVQILEFIALEHTAKNLLIRAVKRPGKRQGPLSAKYEAFRDFWHIRPSFESALKALADRPSMNEDSETKSG